MRRNTGFTILELLVVVAILGILAATAMPLYNTWQQRAYGSEAALTLKRILDGEIMYFLENENYFPEVGNPVNIYHDGRDPSTADIQRTKDALNISIPVGHFLDFTITNTTLPGQPPSCMVEISHYRNLDLFKNGAKKIFGDLDDTGKIDIGYLP